MTADLIGSQSTDNALRRQPRVYVAAIAVFLLALTGCSRGLNSEELARTGYLPAYEAVSALVTDASEEFFPDDGFDIESIAWINERLPDLTMPFELEDSALAYVSSPDRQMGECRFAVIFGWRIDCFFRGTLDQPLERFGPNEPVARCVDAGGAVLDSTTLDWEIPDDARAGDRVRVEIGAVHECWKQNGTRILLSVVPRW